MILVLPLAQAAVEKAVAIDPALGEPHASLAMIAGSYHYDWDSAERELQTAIRLSPSYVTARHWYAEFLTMMGKFEQSEAEFEMARNLDPGSPILLVDIAQLRLFENKPEESLRVLDEALQLDPNFVLAHDRKVFSLMIMRRAREARAELELADRMAHREVPPVLNAWIAAVDGQRADALRFAAEAEESADNAMMLAVVWAELGDIDRGMAWLEQASERHSSGIISVKVNPVFNPLRKSPRFDALLHRMNLT
ncbi:MAG TPA: tetratricopeptide repeat protein [Bryobacteraceae bacterium]|nr:tetratricopeptide repeat protein [Bryobacteraceae bacterium]